MILNFQNCIEFIDAIGDLWAETLGDPRIGIAVLDGSVEMMHPSFRGASLLQARLSGRASGRGLASDHGTHVASIVFGQHTGPVQGVAPRCRGLLVPLYEEGPGGSISPCSDVDLALALRRVAGMARSGDRGASDVRVINISAGRRAGGSPPPAFLSAAIRACTQGRMLIVAAAGNSGGNRDYHLPGAMGSVLTVGALDGAGEPLLFSNWHAAYRAQGILAPGQDILGATAGGGTSRRTGTSYATPVVAGLVGLLLSLQLKLGQEPDPFFIREALLSSALGCGHRAIPDCRRLLAGRLNLRGATAIVTRAAPPRRNVSRGFCRNPEHPESKPT